MTQPSFLKLILLTLLFCFKSNNLISQSNQSYVDSINQYQLFVDSLINSYYSNPATSLSHTITHYDCHGSGWGSGGSADLYQDVEKTTIYQLSYSKHCDTVKTERVFYFLKNKIVLAIITDEGDQRNIVRANYYRNDQFLRTNNLDKTSEKLTNNDLLDGYKMLEETLQ